MQDASSGKLSKQSCVQIYVDHRLDNSKVTRNLAKVNIFFDRGSKYEDYIDPISQLSEKEHKSLQQVRQDDLVFISFRNLRIDP